MITNPLGFFKASSAAPFSPTDISGLLVWLDANTLAGSNGSVVSTWPDLSGNSHNATGSGANLTLALAAVNGKKAITFAGDTFSLTGIFSYSTYSYFIVYLQPAYSSNPVLVGSSGSSYIRFQRDSAPSAIQLSAPSGADIAGDINELGEYGALGFTRSGGGNTCYLDGGRLSFVSGPAAGNQDFSNIGGFSSFVFPGKVAEVVMYDSQLSGANVNKVFGYLNTKYALTGKKFIICEGDSLTKGVGGTAYPTQLYSTLGSGYQIINDGNAGDKFADLTTQASTNIDPYFGLLRPRNIEIVWCGTNDISGDLINGATCYGRLVAYCNARRALGWKVIVLTMVARTGLTSLGLETARTDYNALILANSPVIADAVCDVAALPQFDQESDCANTTYYFDGTHLTTTGYGLIRDAVVTTLTANGW